MATSLDFFERLRWIDGKSLLNTIEPYRRDIFTKALDTFGPDGFPQYNMVIAGRGKKNWIAHQRNNGVTRDTGSIVQLPPVSRPQSTTSRRSVRLQSRWSLLCAHLWREAYSSR
jgi:hypothetical protein